MNIEDFKRDVYQLDTVNGKDISRLTEVSKQLRDDAIFLVEIVINSIKEVSYLLFYTCLVHSKSEASKVLPSRFDYENSWE
jgi:hypothetical protein